MFKSLKRITYRVADVAKAKQWYSEFLDAQPLFETPFAVIFRIGDCSMSLSAGKEPLPENTDWCDVYWDVEDIDAAYRRLIELGATPHTPVRAVLNIKVAKVVDPFGNCIGITSLARSAKDQSVEYQPSETAMTVAFCRALAAREERAEIKGSDTMAELFLTDDAKTRLQDAASRNHAILSLVSVPLYGYLIARTAFIDGIFKKALAEGVPQIVFLGAGYDTRAYRYREQIKSTRIFELDIHSTQNNKKTILTNAGITVPEQVTLVRINFKVDNIGEVLRNAGYRETEKTLFVWEGVTYYLTREAVNATMRFIQSQSPKGSTVCFDYVTEKLESFNVAEPMQFSIRHDALPAFCADFGITLLDHLDAKEMEKRYLTLRDGSLAVNVFTQFNLVHGILG